MSIQNLISATPLPARSPASLQNAQTLQNTPGGDSAAASFSRMLAQARQSAPAPAAAPAPSAAAVPAPAPAPSAAAPPPAAGATQSSAKPAQPDAPVKAGPGTDRQNPATTEPVQPEDANGSTAADARKPPERSARNATGRGTAARAERPAVGDDTAATVKPGDPATGHDADAADAGTLPPHWLATPRPADAATAGAAAAGLARANQTTPVPASIDLLADAAPGAGIEAGSGQNARSPASGDVRDARDPHQASTLGAQRAAGEQPFAAALAAAAEPKHAAAEPLRETTGAAAPGIAAPTSAAAASDTPAPVQASLATPVGSPEFREALGVQVSVLAKDGVEHAELQLNPSEMGPISVRISMEGDQARVDFGADLAATRDVIQAGWAELAASLQDAGFTLSGGGVSQHSAGRDGSGAGNGNGSGTQGGTGARNIAPPDAVSLARAPRTTVRAGGVDLFA